MSTQDDQILAQFESEFNRAFGSLSKLEELLNKIQTQIDKLTEEYNQRVEKEYEVAPTAYSQFMEENFTALLGILIANTEKAIAGSSEFSNPLYASRLMEAVSIPEILEIVMDTTNSETLPILIINILMDQYAGNIGDWGKAVKVVRKNRGHGKVSRKNPETGSSMFFEKYYSVDVLGKTISRTYKRTNKKKGVTAGETRDITERYAGKYLETLMERLDSCGSLAPFWSLLDYGNAPYPGGLSSDIGGNAMPKQAPTHFVSESLGQIKENANIVFKQIYDSIKKKYDKELKEIQDTIEELKVLYEQVIVAIENFMEESSRLTRTLEGDPTVLAEKTDFIAAGLEARVAKKGETLSVTKEFKEQLTRGIDKVAKGLVKGGKVTAGGKRFRINQLMKDFATKMK
jgi:archaellum component FlaC